MNAGRRGTNGWILCPSKTFPNKLYYFNVLTGETAWSLNDVEKRASTNFYNQSEKWQNYPEPDSPPADANWPGFRTGPNSRPYTTPVFGQAAFPKYTLNNDPSVVWAPVQVPMSRSFDQTQHWSDRMQSQFGRFENQNSTNVAYGHDDSMRHWTGFNGYQMGTNQAVFGQKPQSKVFIQPPTFGQMFATTANTCQIPKQVKESIFGRSRTRSESQAYQNNSIFNSKSFENRNDLDFVDFSTLSPQKRTFQIPNKLPNIQNRHNQKPYQNENNYVMSKSLENLTLIDDTGIPSDSKRQPFDQSKLSNFLFNSQTLKNNEIHSSAHDLSTQKIKPFAVGKGDQNTLAKDFESFENNEVCKSNIQHTKRNIQSKDLPELDTTDLRYTLMAKKRKFDINVTSKSGNFEDKKISTTYRNVEMNEAVTPKKRVTFDLDVDIDQEGTVSVETDHQGLDIIETENLNINSLSKLAKPSDRTEHWYIVVDTKVLFDDFEFVEKFVQSDGKCTLLIPHAVRVDIDAMSLGDCRGRQLVIAARQLSRRLATLPRYITIESPQDIEENNQPSLEEDIVNCCLRIMSENYHVVLLTNNEELYDKAKSVDIHCYRLQEIKDGDVPKPEVSFELKKIQTGLKKIDVKEKNNNLLLQCSNPSNPFAPNKDFPVNCFRKRLFDCNTENSLSNVNTTNRQTENHNYESPKFDENQQKTMFPPKNITSQKKCIFEDKNEIQNLDLKLKAFEIQTDRDETRLADKQMASEKENLFLKHTASTPKHTANGMKIKSINGYTIEAHLKSFYVKNKVVEDRLVSRMEEFVCLFNQILEDTLTEILQKNTAPITNNLSPPWSLLEAIECLAELYGDHTTIKIIVDKLSVLLFSGNAENGKILRTMKPNDFMKTLGCGILLVKYLKSILPPSPALSESEERLESLQRSIEEPTVPPDPVLTANAAVLSRSEVHNMEERRNFIKNPSDVLDYLKKHFPEWRTYTEVPDSVNTKEKEQVQSKTKQCPKVVRTSGKNLNFLKLDIKKTMTFNPAREKLKSPELEDQITKPCTEKPKVNQTKEVLQTDCGVADCRPKLDDTKETGPTLPRNLAINRLIQNRIPIMREIDIEKRENVNKDLLKMIDQMTSPGITKYYDIDSITIKKPDEQTDDLNTKKHGNTFTQHSKEGSKVVRGIDVPFAFKMPRDVKQKPTIEGSLNNQAILKKTKTKESQAEAKNDGPKVIRSIKLIDAFEEKFKKIPDEKLDLDVLDYSGIDENSVNDVSETYTIDEDDDDTQELIKSNEVAISTETVKISAENNDTAAENNDIVTVTNDNSAQNNDNLDGGVSNAIKDNGISDIYPFVHKLFSGLSDMFQFIFDFVQTTLNQYDDEITNETKTYLYEKTMEVFLLLNQITEHLKSTIEREANAATLKDIFKTSSDTRISRYRQVITKCLEQAQILQNALKILLTLTNDNFDVYSNSSISNIQYCNIFE